ncbi:MAG: hypothetical protein HY764_00270 [Candidatus Portnoybacteria bacterium]|nr:hypothetical protein [Candidatus Portnoybacteria bacterium]
MGVKGLIGFLLIMGLLIISASYVFISGFAQFIWYGVGLFFILIGGIGLIFSNLYVKAKGNMAFLKTGKGGAEVIKDHGRIIIGFLHEIIPVSLETMKIVVERKGKDSLITNDKLRAEVMAEFYIRVNPDEEGIKSAARTLGSKISAGRVGGASDDRVLDQQVERVKALEQEKLIDALRTVAAKRSLEDLNLDRSTFKSAVMEVVKDGLKQNGLELEDVTISRLDQAPREVMDPNNQFDAQGLKNLQQVVSAALVQENEFKRDAELAVKKKNVETASAILAQDQELNFKTADQDRDVRAYKANQDKEASVAELQNQELIARRGIEKDRAIALENVTKEQQVQTAGVEMEKVVATANVEKDKQVEVTSRQKLIAIAETDAQRAEAEAKRNKAEAEAERAKQAIETVSVTSQAERQKAKAIIDKQAEIEKERQDAQMKADVKAYTISKEAQGRKEAAEADYLAKTRAAEAELVEKTKRAEGDLAIQMVPVSVSNNQVDVDQRRVQEVLKPELEAKAASQTVSVELTLGQLKIQAAEKIGVAFAGAIGGMMAGANMNIYGDPDTLAKMTQKFSQGVGMSNLVDGFLNGGDGFKALLPVLAPILNRFGIDMSSITSIASLQKVAETIQDKKTDSPAE